MLLLCGSVWGRAQKGVNADAWPLEFCPGGSCLLAFALIPDTSIFPHMPLLPFQLLPRHWSLEGVSLSKSQACCGTFNRWLLRISPFLLPPQPPLGFTVRSYGDLSSWQWITGLGSLVWGWDPWLPSFPSWFLSTTHVCGTAPSTCLNECDFFNSLVVRLLYSSIFWQFWVILVLLSSSNFCCGCARRRVVFTYCSILTGTLNCFLNFALDCTSLVYTTKTDLWHSSCILLPH